MDQKITHEGELLIGSIAIPCYVTADGSRILSATAMQNALKLNDYEGDRSSVRISRKLNQKWIQPYLYPEGQERTYEPVDCYRGKQKIRGYKANVLVDICDAFLEARDNIEMNPRQLETAKECEILLRGFARVGLTALIDEATGYQFAREHDELQKILSAYVSEEVLKWQKTFDIEFYQEMFRLWNQPFTAENIKGKRPSFFGKLTTKYIYNHLPAAVIEKAKEQSLKNDNGGYKYRWHQSLTKDVGREHLKKQIQSVTTLMSVCDTKEEFQVLFDKKFNKGPVQMELDFKK